MDKKRVVVGMSGGVDSSVAAWLLKEQGYEVVGVTMQIWQEEPEQELEENGGCCGLSAVEDARRVAAMLDIPHYVMNFRADFQKYVIDYFVEEYLIGHTPNPCIACNRYVTWESLLKRGMGIGADYIATGHYARVRKLPSGRYTLQKSATEAKDQTYALYNLTQRQLAHTLMPVGEYTKEEIRAIAGRIGLRTANKPDSQEICFIPDHNYARFIEREQKGAVPPPGNFVTKDGKALGQHKGITHYTIGQRKGLGIALGVPMFVTELRPDTNEVVLGGNEEVFGTALSGDKLNLMSIPDLEGELEVTAKIRYNHTGAPCTIRKSGEGRVFCQFHEPVRAITPGQAVVFYNGDLVVGGATIVKPDKSESGGGKGHGLAE